MTEERLKEIKDSIDLQMKVMDDIGLEIDPKGVLQEEVDLYDEVCRLQKANECLQAFINGFKNRIEFPGAKTIKIDHVCDATRVLARYETWLKEGIDDKYGEEERYACLKCYNKLREIKERIANEKEKIQNNQKQ